MLDDDISIEESKSSVVDSQGDGSTTNAFSRTSTTSKSSQEELARKETAAVFRLRLLVILILLASAALVSYLVHHITQSGEDDEFESHYEGATEKVIESFQDILVKMSSISGLGVALTAHDIDHNGNQESVFSWPFVSLSNFMERAGNARHLSGSLFVGICPIVERANFDAWDEYVQADTDWIDEANQYQDLLGINRIYESDEHVESSRVTDRKVDLMHYFDKQGIPHREENPEDFYLPMWQSSPLLHTGIVNENILRRRNVSDLAWTVIEQGTAVLGEFMLAPPGTIHDENRHTARLATLRSMADDQEVPYLGDPVSNLYMPVYSHFNETLRKVSAILMSTIHWRSYLRKILPTNVRGIIVVLHHECKGTLVRDAENLDSYRLDAFTYEIDGAEAIPIGFGDHHDPRFGKWERRGDFTSLDIVDGTLSGLSVDPTCLYHVHLYPSQTFYDDYHTMLPLVITFSIVSVFLFVIFMFIVYDRLVERRQTIVAATASKTAAIVSSLFPKSVTERLMQGEGLGIGTKTQLKGFLNGEGKDEGDGTSPIADLFSNCTIFFADIAGFTAWSSTREASQVFILLQTVFQAFDALAKRRRVFKVETIGDSYMAVTGLPEPQEQHAVIMVRFAADCMAKMQEIVKELECTLGPDTAELAIRVGIHSGPVTAGVLRGDRARFQLFGDTVNTASRCESTGLSGKIQITGTTANLLVHAGKKHWLKPRDDQVKAKGKGVVQTYFVNPTHKKSGSSVASGDSSTEHLVVPETVLNSKSKTQRLVDWMEELFVQDIRKLIHARMHKNIGAGTGVLTYHLPDGKICLDEVQKAVTMEEFHPGIAACTSPHLEIVVDETVRGQIKDYIATIASLYRNNNPFHNFEHACHVAMSVNKMIQRVTKPELTDEQLEKLKNEETRRSDIACHIHEATYGVNSSPLARFALTFSALVHDVDHRGCSNLQLSKEEPEMASHYRGISIAEQNSLDIAWDVLMEERFVDLRQCLFANESELLHFRRLLVNVVLATDIFDKELNDMRKNRWNEAFSSDVEFDSNLRATIVLEHIIQTSDVSHTMQHWHVYQKWNKHLFTEMYQAWKAGRLAKDPSTFWYKGEIGFFDNYIIPLAKKLKDCGVFGVSSDEYLTYAEQNRAEWAERGEEMVANLVHQVDPDATTSQ